MTNKQIITKLQSIIANCVDFFIAPFCYHNVCKTCNDEFEDEKICIEEIKKVSQEC